MASIIEQAIHLEATAEANYREAAERTSDSSAGAVLELLADEEAEHAKTLRGMSDVANLGRSDVLGRAKTWVRGVVEGGLPAISSDAGIVTVLRRAMDIEQMTESFYRENAATAEDAAVIDLFTVLADIEKTHFLLVGSLLEYFDRPNEWIESAEFGLRDEY
ncbi:ferritin family protein [Candidatus Bipolaricaulota bacterium]